MNFLDFLIFGFVSRHVCSIGVNCHNYHTCPPYRAAKARKALSISGEKNDMGDAKVISIFAKQVKMQEVSLKTIELKRLITTRRLLVNKEQKLF